MKKDKFFGEVENISNNRFAFNGYRKSDPNTATIHTDFVYRYRDGLVMPVAHNKLVFLKDWQVRTIYCFEYDWNCFAVKLSRKSFRPYTFRRDFSGFSGYEEKDFDFFREMAQIQAFDMKWKCGLRADTEKSFFTKRLKFD